MYQVIDYNYYTKKVIIRDDELGWQEVDYKPTYYKLDDNGEFFTLDGKRVSPTHTMDKTQPTKFYEIDIPTETNALVDIYKESDDTPKWHNVVFLDIECEIGGALTVEYIKRAPMKITSVAFYDSTLKKYYCLILDESKQLNRVEEKEKEIIPYSTEKDLLKGFLDKWEECDPTIISGWNSEFFDIPYLYYRICNVLGNDHANRLSPLKRCKPIGYGDEETIKISGINHLDYMLLHKKFIMSQEPSYALAAIGEKYVKLGKIEYEGSLDRLFQEDVHKFIEYNLRDVEILIALDNKLQFIELTKNICHLCHVSYENIYYSTALNEGAILTYLRRKDIVSPNKPTTINPALKGANEEYAGGYLKDPVPGLYQWVSDLDFTSLYPSIIRNLNMGIETLVCRIKNRDKYDNKWGLEDLKQLPPHQILKIEKVTADRKVQEIEMEVDKFINFIESKNMIISANGTVFRTDKNSIVADVLNDWFDKRKEYKNKMKEAYKVLKDPELGEFYNKRQHAMKIKLNDLYGCYAQNGWRYSDGNLFISKAITLTGQRLDQESINFVNKEINTELDTDKDYVVTADTDSLFFEMKDLIAHRNPQIDIKSREQVVPVALEITAEYQEKTKPFLQNLCKTQFNCDNEYFELKQEVVLERGYFAGKRRYAQFIVNKEGVSTEELDIKGMDIMKSNMTPMYATFGKSLLMDIMYGKPKKEIDKKIQDFRKEVKSTHYSKLAKPTGVKQIKSYIAAPPAAGQIFSKLGNKCPINTKSAIWYNDLLKFKGLDKQYPAITEGSKIKFIPLKKNPYGIEVLAFTNESPPFLLEFLDKYADTDSGFNNVLLNKLEGIYEDIYGPNQFPSLNENVTRFFNF